MDATRRMEDGFRPTERDVSSRHGAPPSTHCPQSRRARVKPGLDTRSTISWVHPTDSDDEAVSGDEDAQEGAAVKRDPAVGIEDVASRRTTRERLEAAYPSRGESAAQMRRALREYLSERALDAGVVYDVVLAADEAFINAVSHAEAADGLIRVTASVSDGEAAVEVRDGGGGFELRPPGQWPFPDVRRTSGRGVFLIERLMDEVSVRSGQRGTTVRIVRRIG
jgi:anti-sigma regulatory factor (Ser/Thr protein kinase)